MPKLADTAQIVMDLYYQQYRTDEDFFMLEHFMYLCGVAYSKLLEEEYKEARLIAKAETGFTEISLQSDWLKTEDLDVQPTKDEFEYENDFFATLSIRPFSFPYDPYSLGIQSIKPNREACQDMLRLSQKQEWMMSIKPFDRKIRWMPVGCKITFKNARQCGLKKVRILYIPEITDPACGKDGGDVPRSKEKLIIESVLQLMMIARNGTVVDTTNNSNPNKTIQTEIDTAFGNIKTKPI